MTKALYRKWRPQGWEEVTAQDHVIQTLKNAVVNERVAHAYLFAGPRGTGKTTTARLLAKAVNCLDPELAQRPCNTCDYCLALNAGRFLDLIEIDAASNTSVEDVRDLRDKINFSPSQGRYKVYIIDEVHMLSTAAFNALLKTLEEPPPHAIFILATTEIHKIPATVLSRCQRHEFRRIPLDEMVVYLKEKSRQEQIDVDDAVFTEVARQATGSLRDAISLLDQLTSSQEHITLEMAQKVLGTATSLRVIEVVSALADNDTSTGLGLINTALDSGTDPRQFARQIVAYLRNILLYKMGNTDQVEVGEAVIEQVKQHADQFSMPNLLRAIEAFNQATLQEQANWHPGLGLELAFTWFLTEPQPEDLPMQNQIKPSAASGPKKAEKKSKPETKTNPVLSQTSADDDTTATGSPQAEKPPQQAQTETPKESRKVESSPSSEPISLSDIQKAWSKIKSMVKKHNPRTEGLLNTSKLTGLKGNILVLGFSSDTLKSMMEKESNINLTCDILEEVFGQPLFIECIVTTHEGSTLPENIKIDQDGMVGTATRDLGGRISSAKEEE
jgi:DNA polymerase III subunit gamma/tau